MPEARKKPATKTRQPEVSRGRAIAQKAGGILGVGFLGSFLITVINVFCDSNEGLRSVLIVTVPGVSVLLSEIGKWLWDAIAPSNGLQIRTRRNLNRKSAEISRQLANPNISQAAREELQVELDRVAKGLVASYDLH